MADRSLIVCAISAWPFSTATAVVLAGAYLISVLWAQASEFNPQVVISRAMPPIKDAATISAAEAGRSLGEAELVLGVTVNGVSRAYPINMLTGPQREVINDTLGGRAIAATW